MNKKILTIKNVLIIITLCFGLISSLSKCQAYTFEDLGRFLDACIDNNITSSYCNTTRLNQYKTLYNKLKNENIDWSQYYTFVFASNPQDTQQYLFCGRWINYVGGPNSNGTFSLEYYESPKKYYWYSSGLLSQADIRDGWQIDSNYKFVCGLVVGGNQSVLNNNVVVCQYRWDPNTHPIIPPFSFTPYGILASGDWYYQKFSYTGNICLGELGDNDFYQLDIKLKNPNGVQLGVISIVPDVRHY